MRVSRDQVTRRTTTGLSVSSGCELDARATRLCLFCLGTPFLRKVRSWENELRTGVTRRAESSIPRQPGRERVTRSRVWSSVLS